MVFPVITRKKTHCDVGHAVTPENTVVVNGKWAACRLCVQDSKRRYMRRRRNTINPRVSDPQINRMRRHRCVLPVISAVDPDVLRFRTEFANHQARKAQVRV